MKDNKQVGNEHVAKAKSTSLSISTKHSIEISREIRYKNTSVAKKILENVIDMVTPMPMRKFNQDTGHKRGMAAGRFPQKAAKEFLKIVKSVEANALSKGLNVSNLKIIKIVSNKASIPSTGGRFRRGTKRTNVEIEVKEVEAKKKLAKVKNIKKADTKITKVKPEEPKAEDIKTNKVEKELQSNEENK